MGLKEPKSVSECLYFTKRSIGKDGHVKAWVFRAPCEKCGGNMETPKGLKKAKEYTCDSCGHQIEAKEYETSQQVNIQYTCDNCKNSGEVQIPYKRKKVQISSEEDKKKKAVDALQFICGKCGEKINITKKMKS